MKTAAVQMNMLVIGGGFLQISGEASGLVGQDGGCETLGEFAPSGKSQQSRKWETERFSTLC